MPTLEDFATNEQIKAEYKKTLPIYLIRAGLLFSATTIPNIIYNLKLFS